MNIGRNAPCPCGSGRLYKRCCWKRDRSGAAGETLRAEREHAAAADWEADVLPLPTTTADRPGSRLASVLIVSTTGFVLAGDVIHDPPGEYDAIAELLAAAILRTAADTRAPGRVSVRYAALVEPLARRLGRQGIRVTARPLPALDPAAAGLWQHFAGREGPPAVRVSMAPSWRAWGLGAERTAAIFRAAAAWYRAAPWRDLENADLLTLTMPGGRTWTACVMGAGGEEFGLALYAERQDLENLLAGNRGPNVPQFTDAMMALTFERRGDLPVPMRKEIASAGWEVASTQAYPQLMTAHMPGGGVTAAIADELTLALRTTAAFAAVLRSDPDAMADGTTWTDPATSVAVDLGPRDDTMWQPLPVLEPCLPGGPGADPEAALRDPEDPAVAAAMHEEHAALLEAFGRALATSGLSAAVCRKHVTNAGLLLDYLEGFAVIPIRAMTECDLREFYFAWSVRKVLQPDAVIRSLPASLEKFLAFAASQLQISWPWAAAIVRDRATRNARIGTVPRGFAMAGARDSTHDELSDDLAARVLLHGPGLAGVGVWGPLMGEEEWRLDRELHRRWQLWRDEAIARGTTDGHEVWAALVRRQLEWELAPHPRLGVSPSEAIRRERAANDAAAQRRK